MVTFRRIFAFLGPGFVTGASDDDPSAIATYSQTGVQFGYVQLWTALFSFPFITVIQETAARIGMYTGKGLSGVVKEYYPKPLLYITVFLLILANVVNLGADLGAMAASAQLLLALPFPLWLLIMGIVIVSLEILSTYRTYSKFLKYLAFSLMSYFFTALIVKQDWREIAFFTLVPHLSLDREFILNIAALLGTRASPYMFFWQPSQEVEEEIEQEKFKAPGKEAPEISGEDISRMRVNTIMGMFFSNFIMFFIMITTASTLGIRGLATIETADQAAQALKPLAGDLTFFLFAAGIIGTGLLTVPILAGSAAYALSETFGWEAGLNKTFRQAHGFYGVIIAAVALGLLINLTSVRPFRMLYYAAVLNGIVAPLLMFIIMLVSNNKKIMGDCTNSRIPNIIGWSVTVAAAAIAGVLVASAFSVN